MARIRIICSSYDDLHNPWYAGGGAFAVHEVAKRLAVINDVTVLTGAYPGAENRMIDGVNYERAGLRWGGPHLGQLWFALTLPFRAWARRASFDLWIESFGPPWSVSGVPLAVKQPVIGLVHMLAGEDMWRKYHMPFFLIERIGLRAYRNIVVLTEEMRKTIHRYHPTASIDVIPNGVTIPSPEFHPGAKRHVLFLGRIEMNQKGLDLLIDAYRRVAPHISHPLVIAGGGAKREVHKLRSHIAAAGLAHRISLVGRVEGEQKAALLRDAAVVVLPSRFETFGSVALEAMAYGIPVVCFDIDMLHWIPEQCAFKARPFSTDDLAAQIERALRSKEHVAQRCVEFAARYDWASAANAYASVIERCMPQHASRKPQHTAAGMEDIVHAIVDRHIPCLFIAPHLDDAALSAGGLISYLADKTDVTIATVFTEGGSGAAGNTLSARRFLAQVGYRDAEKLYADRRAEDMDVCREIGVSWKHLGFTDALWRTIPRPSIIRRTLGTFLPEFLHRHPTFRLHIARKNVADRETVADVVRRLRSEFPDGERYAVFAPFSLDTHIDHMTVRRACEEAFSDPIWWIDIPYRSVDDAFGADTDRYICAIYSGHEAEKRALVERYRSQVNALFPGGRVPETPDCFVIPPAHPLLHDDAQRADVTVVLPAYNESANIGNALRSLADQQEVGFRITKILVISDGSTDGTADIARGVGDHRIAVREHTERRGKAMRLNEAHAETDMDIIVTMDADTILAHDRALAELITPFRYEPSIGLIGGHGEPVPARTFTEEAVNVGHYAREPLRGNNVFSADGKLMAYRSELARRVHFPEGTIGVDHYLYFACRKEGMDYRYAPRAKAFFRSPATLRDAVRQNIRFSAVPARMEKYFGQDATEREYHVPLTRRLAAKYGQAVRHPLATAYAFLIYTYCNMRGRLKERALTSMWDIAVTTKQALPHYE